MSITVITRWPTAAAAQQDAERVASLIRAQVSVQSMPIRVNTYERDEKSGGGFAYLLECGPVSVSCRGLTRYCVRYSDPGRHVEEFDAVLVEDALVEARQFIESRIAHMRLALAVMSGPEA